MLFTLRNSATDRIAVLGLCLETLSEFCIGFGSLVNRVVVGANGKMMSSATVKNVVFLHKRTVHFSEANSAQDQFVVLR